MLSLGETFCPHLFCSCILDVCLFPCLCHATGIKFGAGGGMDRMESRFLGVHGFMSTGHGVVSLL